MRRGARRLGTAVVMAAMCCVQAACYERVVRTKGIGADTQDVYEGNLPDEPDAVDELIWGPSKKKDKR